jgi:hypothetical protein
MKGIFISISILLILLEAELFASQSTISASVTVVCPGIVSIKTAPAYMKYLNLSLNYSLEETANCIIPNATGVIKIINKANSSIIFSKHVSFYNVSSISTQRISISTNSLPNTTYYASLNLSELGYAIKGLSSQFELVNPANVVVKISAYPSTINPGTPISISIELNNTGSLASSSIGINGVISGPQKIYFSYLASPLAPHQEENISFSFSNITAPGSYTIYAFASYNSLLKSSNQILNSSSYAFSSFSVSYPAPPSPSPSPSPKPVSVPKPITSIPQVGIISAPLLVSAIAGTSSLSQLSIVDTSNATEIINLSVPSTYSSMLKLSATSFFIKPNENVTIQLGFFPNSTTQSGIYIIPINITASIANKSTTVTEYVQFEVLRNRNSSILNQLILANNTNVADGILKIYNPTNTTMVNVRASTLIPKSAVSNISQINAYGLINNITEENGYYVINWLVPYLPKGSSTYAYYSIYKPESETQLSYIQNIMEVPSYVKPSSTLRLININVPTFYANATGHIVAEELYTGTGIQSVAVQLLGQPGVRIVPSLIIENASPNQVLVQTFNVSVPSSGTAMLSLYISMQGFNETYSIPALVLAPPTTTTIPQTVQPKPSSLSISLESALIFTILIILVLSIIVENKRRGPRYSEERVSSLKEIREIIKRE